MPSLSTVLAISSHSVLLLHMLSLTTVAEDHLASRSVEFRSANNYKVCELFLSGTGLVQSKNSLSRIGNNG